MADKTPVKDTEELEEIEELEGEDAEEAEETKGIRAVDLATELGIDPKRLRGWLRKEFPRAAEDKNTSWLLTEEQVDAAWDRFGSNDEDDSEETESDED
jgi:hypothetical protein